ncbi:hypothetical protein QFZ31_001021 [Neobacillus niacini]|nr:hypothetical protein [Neobacillus niacini]
MLLLILKFTSIDKTNLLGIDTKSITSLSKKIKTVSVEKIKFNPNGSTN